MTRKKVAIIHPDLGIGGAERLIIDAVLELIALNYDVSEPTKWEALFVRDINTFSSKCQRTGRIVHWISQYTRLLRRNFVQRWVWMRSCRSSSRFFRQRGSSFRRETREVDSCSRELDTSSSKWAFSCSFCQLALYVGYSAFCFSWNQ